MQKLIIAVVCHQGIGSSFWLKILVQKILAKYQIPAYVVQSDLNNLSSESFDIVIGMSYLEDDIKRYGSSHIIINNILDEELQDKLLANKIIKTVIQ